MNRLRIPVALLLVVQPLGSLSAQTPRTGLEVGGVPALNFDADEGFGYGVVLELYSYGAEGAAPYLWTLQPTVFLTTEGRRDVTLFFDSPYLLPGGWRVDASLGSEEQIATPYYGTGNATPYFEANESEENPYYYRFGRTRRRLAANLQHPVGHLPLRVLVGAAISRVTVRPVPENEGTTFLEQELGGSPAPSGWSNSVRGGVVWDTRDRETGPRRGTWTELLVQRADGALGSDWSFTRVTLADRRYWSLGRRLVLANRLLLQHVTAGAPLPELHVVQTSYKAQEGLGGARSVRGIPKNRFVGRGLFIWNTELRWRAAEFELFGRLFHATLSVFHDAGRVWEGGPRLDELIEEVHRGYGGGLRIGMGENFVVAVDGGTSRLAGLPIYVGLGYLF